MTPRTAPVQQTAANRLGQLHLGHLLLAALVALTAAMAIAYEPTPATGSTHAQATARTHPPAPHHPWVRASLSHYGEGDGLLGQRTACGKIVTTRSNFVAALTPDLARCGLKITIRYRGRTIRTTVQDRGAWRTDGRHLDAAPGVRHRLGFTGVAQIHYHKGWR